MNMHNKQMEKAILNLHDRRLSDGGFSELPQATYRVDATAWAVIALVAAGWADGDFVAAARRRLVASQLKDGRVSIAQDHPDAFWPTALAALAWQGSVPEKNAHARAISFLLNTTAKDPKVTSGDPYAGDTSIKAWPWIDNTYAWVEPTALALIALRTAGNETHPRAKEAVRMLLNRQLPHGGWNYGSTVVYGQELYPQPGSTGVALAALAGHVARSEVGRSLDYLASQAEQCRSPFSLSWALLGLSAWGEKPGQSGARIAESLALQEKYGIYGTSLLSLLVTSFFTEGDIAKHLQKQNFLGMRKEGGSSIP